MFHFGLNLFLLSEDALCLLNVSCSVYKLFHYDSSVSSMSDTLLLSLLAQICWYLYYTSIEQLLICLRKDI